jgi:hypothetical protein
MKRKYLQKALSLAALVLSVLIAASVPRCTSVVAGGGSEAGNGIVSGNITDEKGNPACSTIVMIVPKGYNPVMDNPIPDSSIDTTDGTGEYRCKAPREGVYNILAIHLTSGSRTLVQNVMVETNASPPPQVPVAVLERPGRIRVTLLDSADVQNGYFYIPGTTVAAFPAGAHGYALLDSVPAAIVPSVNYGMRNSEDIPRSICDSVKVTSGVTATVLFSSWMHSRNLFLNTTASGANITTSVYRFPVLVRLNAGNFQFNQARADGRDVRFVKSDNTPLPFEIASWDSSHAQAGIWVMVDTVYGHDSTHYMTMLWGTSTSSVTGLSNSAAVFDTAGGFEAVWHFDGNCNDATYHRKNGTNYGTTDTVGIIGVAKKFHGSDSVRVPGLMDSLQTVTLSAWVRCDSTGPSGGEIISVGNNVLLRVDDARGNAISGTMGSMHFSSDTAWVNVFTGQYLKGTGWHYLAFACDGTRHIQSLYIDGLLVSAEYGQNPISYLNFGSNTLIGAHGDGRTPFGFAGIMDEIRVCKAARTADWIRLCYMNQKVDDSFLSFK